MMGEHICPFVIVRFVCIQKVNTARNRIVERAGSPQIVDGQHIITYNSAAFANTDLRRAVIENEIAILHTLVIIEHFHHPAAGSNFSGGHTLRIG
ncbi:hypothetical protein D3C73_1123470 [compost metagenome]